jgi:hypothetical protein
MLKPKAPVRRFDVFAEYNRQQAMKKGRPTDEAEGYGLWVAKVVASGGGRSLSQRAPRGKAEDAKEEPEEETPKEKWKSLNGEPQTDELFHKEIVRRMGEEFYETVFRPAIEDAVRQDKGYTEIRDSIRKDWKP